MPTFDAIVYRATASGCMAAIRLAREGLSVGVIEYSQFKGGLITGGLGISDAAATRTWSGVPQEFIEAVVAQEGVYPNEISKWTFRASVAKAQLEALITAEGASITFFHGEYLTKVNKNVITPALGEQVSEIADEGTRIVSIETNLATYTADHWIDASYEGDLAAMAGVTMVYGREARSTYGDPAGGRNDDLQAVSAYSVVDADGDLYPRAQHAPAHSTGQADNTIMAYGFRLMVTNDAAKKVDWPAPPGYDRTDFLAEIHEANNRGLGVHDSHTGFIIRRAPPDGEPQSSATPAYQFATNGSDIIGPTTWTWLHLTPPERQEVAEQMAYKMLGRFYTYANDAAVPVAVRDSFSAFGLCNDEFQTEYILVPGWSHSVYVREGRRIVGQAVVSYAEASDQLNWPDQVGVAAYFTDSKASYQVQLSDGTTAREGWNSDDYNDFIYWGVPMRALLPARGQADNLVVPVCASISGMAFGSYRLEPIWMQMGDNAGVITAVAKSRGTYAALVPYQPVKERLESLNAVFKRYG